MLIDHVDAYGSYLQFKYPKHFSNELRDLLSHMIEKDLTRRYGNLVNGVNDIKNHNWFSDVNWLAVIEKKVSFHANVTFHYKMRPAQICQLPYALQSMTVLFIDFSS